MPEIVTNLGDRIQIPEIRLPKEKKEETKPTYETPIIIPQFLPPPEVKAYPLKSEVPRIPRIEAPKIELPKVERSMPAVEKGEEKIVVPKIPEIKFTGIQRPKLERVTPEKLLPSIKTEKKEFKPF